MLKKHYCIGNVPGTKNHGYIGQNYETTALPHREKGFVNNYQTKVFEATVK